jgi:dTDP-glucose 4,6-dehydratase
MKNPTIIITGCAGFIGSHAVEYFAAKGYRVIGIDSLTYAGRLRNMDAFGSGVSFHKLDIVEKKKVEQIAAKNDVEWIVNFAAETHVDNSIDDAQKFIHANVRGVDSLLKVCQATDASLLHVSTDEVYGSLMKGEFFETDPLQPRNPYAATKAASEHLIKAYENTHGIKSIVVRPSNNFGPRQHGEKFLPTITRSLLNGKKIPIYGDGSNVRDWFFVKDNVAAIEFLLNKGVAGEAYNVTSKNEMTNLELVSRICDLCNVSFEEAIEFVADRPGHDARYSINNDKLVSLGFGEFTSFELALKSTVESFIGEG